MGLAWHALLGISERGLADIEVAARGVDVLGRPRARHILVFSAADLEVVDLGVAVFGFVWPVGLVSLSLFWFSVYILSLDIVCYRLGLPNLI